MAFHTRIYHSAVTDTGKQPAAIFGDLHNNPEQSDLTGEYEDRNFILTRGDSRIAITIAKNEYTAKLNRENRFIVDDPLSTRPMAYLLTKPLKLGWSYGDDGCYKFVLQEVTANADDNLELQIADYYKHFPKPDKSPEIYTERKEWL